MTAVGRLASRRQFIKHVAASAAVGGLPAVMPASVLGRAAAAAPSARLRLGLIGCGSHGVGWNMKQIFRWADAQILAVCDVDADHLEIGRKAVDAHYGAAVGSGYKPCAVYGDFRELVRRKDLDAVAVCTPDHWHVLPALMAVASGKDVICEKPLTLFVEEGQRLVAAFKRHKRVFQTASENRSIDVYFRLVELVRGGVIGRLRHIELRAPLGNTNMRVLQKSDFGRETIEEPPARLNYDMWLGQAAKMPYAAGRVHGNFRWNLAFSGGVITDWGAHLIDLAQWGHDSQTSGPVEAEGKGDFPAADAFYNTAPTFRVDYRYADGVTLRLSAGAGDLDPKAKHEGPIVGRTPLPGIRFEGADGWIECHGWRGTLKASRREMLDAVVDAALDLGHRPTEIVPRASGGLGGEYRDFFDAVKSGGATYAPAEVGHRTITVAHLGNIAMMLGRKVRWDPAAEKFVGDPQADAMLSRPQRAPWTMDNVETWL